MAGGGGGKEEEEESRKGTSGGSPKGTAPSSTDKGPLPLPNVIELLKGEGSPEDLTRVLLTEIERGLCALPTAVGLTPTAARTKKESAE